jgi:hypothetical protein
VGKGCWAAASEGVVDGAGESGADELGAGESGAFAGGFAGLAVSPGNGNCSAAEGFFTAGGGQGLAA